MNTLGWAIRTITRGLSSCYVCQSRAVAIVFFVSGDALMAHTECREHWLEARAHPEFDHAEEL